MSPTRVSIIRLILSIALALAAFLFMGYNGHPLTQHPESPHGILNLELPFGGKAKVEAILAEWGEAGRVIALQNCYWDFPFIAIYLYAFVTVLKWLKENKTNKTSSFALWLYRIAFWPAVLDVIENIGMMYWLKFNEIPEWTVPVVTSASAFKWLLVFLIIGFSTIAFFQPSHKKNFQ